MSTVAIIILILCIVIVVSNTSRNFNQHADRVIQGHSYIHQTYYPPYANRAENFDALVRQELMLDNIVLAGRGSIYIIGVMYDDTVGLYPAGSNRSNIYEYSYSELQGFDLKTWITNQDRKQVLDALFIANGFNKYNTIAFNFYYSKGDISIHNAGYPGGAGNWYMKKGDSIIPVSYLHEIQNNLIGWGSPLDNKLAFG